MLQKFVFLILMSIFLGSTGYADSRPHPFGKCWGNVYEFGEDVSRHDFRAIFLMTTLGVALFPYTVTGCGFYATTVSGDHDPEALHNERLRYLRGNRQRLHEEIAQGKGRALQDLGSLMGCGMQTKVFAKEAKANYESLFKDEPSEELLLARFVEMTHLESLKKLCH